MALTTAERQRRWRAVRDEQFTKRTAALLAIDAMLETRTSELSTKVRAMIAEALE